MARAGGRNWIRYHREMPPTSLLPLAYITTVSFLDLFICTQCVWVFWPAYMSVHMCVVPREFRRGYHILWNWSYRWLWAMWLLGIKPKFSGRAASAFNHWAHSLFSYIAKVYITGDGTAHRRLGIPTSISRKKIPPATDMHTGQSEGDNLKIVVPLQFVSSWKKQHKE